MEQSRLPPELTATHGKKRKGISIRCLHPVSLQEPLPYNMTRHPVLLRDVKSMLR